MKCPNCGKQLPHEVSTPARRPLPVTRICPHCGYKYQA